jgi:Type II secretion system (T2SS), protein E, N-terminal domain
VSLRSRLPLLGDASPGGAADVSPSGSPGVSDELTPEVERKGEMSSFESTGFPSPATPPADGHDLPAAEPFAAPALTPLQPFDEVQPLQPLDATTPVESYPLQQPETVEFQPPGQQVEPLQPLAPPPALEPLQPTMPPPLPLLTGVEPSLVEPTSAGAPPVPTPEDVANLGVPLGTLIFRAGLLTEEQLEDALQEGVRSGKRLGEVLLEGGLIDERDLGRLLADQKGLRFVELSQLTLDPAATALLSAEKAHMFAALPVGFEEGVPVVAVADPSNELVTENLRRALDSDPRLVVASRSDLHSTIDLVHGATPDDEPVVEEPVAETPVVEAPGVEEPRPVPVAAEPAFAAPTPEPQPEPVMEHVPVPEPVAEVQPEPAPTYEAPAPPELPPLAAEVEVEPEPAAAAVPEPAPEPVAEQTPEPALRPVEVEQVAPLVPEAPEAVAEPAPVLPEPEPVPVTPELQPTLVEPAPEPVYNQIEQAPEQPEPTTAAEHGLPSAISYDVALRLADGERVAIGSFSDPQKAREYAREVVRHLSEDAEEWPFFSGRFMRPDTIVSVDIVPVGEPDRWLGSSVRSNWASRLNRQ